MTESKNAQNEYFKQLAKQVSEICHDKKVTSFVLPSLNTAKKNKGTMNSNFKESQAAVVSKYNVSPAFASAVGVPIVLYLKNAICVYSNTHGDPKKDTKEISDKIEILKERIKL